MMTFCFFLIAVGIVQILVGIALGKTIKAVANNPATSGFQRSDRGGDL